MSMSSTHAACRRDANLSRVASLLASRSDASRSTSRPRRSSKLRCVNVSLAWRCSSSAFAMPVKPRAWSQSNVGCVSKRYLLRSVVVILASDVGVLQGQLFCFGLQEGLIQARLQDGLDGRHGPRLDRDTPPTGGIEPCRLIAFGQQQHAQAGAEPLFRMRTRIHYNTVRPHSSLGYRPPAPEAIVPMDQRPITHLLLMWTTQAALLRRINCLAQNSLTGTPPLPNS